jgi:hypothetical protein
MLDKIKKWFSSFNQKTVVTTALIFTVSVVLFLIVVPAKAQSTFTGGWVPHINSVIDGKSKTMSLWTSPNAGYLQAAVVGLSQVNLNSVGGTAVGGYFSAECVGFASFIQDECVGSYSRVDCIGPYWCAGAHAEVWDTRAANSGGTVIGFSVELNGAAVNPNRIGINIQPKPNMRDVIGLQFQNGASYKHAIDLDGAFIKIGQVDAVPFCIKFSGRTQLVEFWRGCGEPGAVRRGFVNMNWEAPDTQLN